VVVVLRCPKPAPVAETCVGRSGEDSFGGGTAAGHCRRDSFALQGIDQSGGVSHEQQVAVGGNGADHAHFQPTTQPWQAGDRCLARQHAEVA
jgi:hypothetical protein